MICRKVGSPDRLSVCMLCAYVLLQVSGIFYDDRA